MTISKDLNAILCHKPWLSEKECESLKDAIKIVQAYETIPDGHVMTIYNPDEYMIVERIK
jgi:hypothetical protein